MNHMIDACEYCGTFQTVTIEKVEDNGDARAICANCLSMFWNDEEDEEVEDTELVSCENYKWKEISSIS